MWEHGRLVAARDYSARERDNHDNHSDHDNYDDNNQSRDRDTELGFTVHEYVESLVIKRPALPRRDVPGLVEPNLWNVQPATDDGACAPRPATTSSPMPSGTVTWKDSATKITMLADLQHTVLAGAGPAGYPELVYGWSPWASDSSPQSSLLQFPI